MVQLFFFAIGFLFGYWLIGYLFTRCEIEKETCELAEIATLFEEAARYQQLPK